MGDDKYGDERTEALAAAIGLKRLFLHACYLAFALPEVGRLELRAALDEDLDNALNKLRN